MRHVNASHVEKKASSGAQSGIQVGWNAARDYPLVSCVACARKA
jgi:hypothetical protein